MSFGVYGILILFGAFVLLLIINPNISCFGKRVKSPFRPLLRKKKKKRKSDVTDYNFRLVDPEDQVKRPPDLPPPSTDEKKTEDYGFRLD